MLYFISNIPFIVCVFVLVSVSYDVDSLCSCVVGKMCNNNNLKSNVWMGSVPLELFLQIICFKMKVCYIIIFIIIFPSSCQLIFTKCVSLAVKFCCSSSIKIISIKPIQKDLSCFMILIWHFSCFMILINKITQTRVP